MSDGTPQLLDRVHRLRDLRALTADPAARAAIDEAIKEAQADLDGRTAVEQIAKEKPERARR
jgi:hypothetical protein